MKRILLLSACFAVMLGLLAGAQHQAEAQTAPLTEAHLQRIRDNCVHAQSLLNQLHTSDALLRVNRGQLYESISTKLMAPFNSRVALNKLDGSRMVEQTTEYERQLGEFRAAYKAYEETLSQALKANCKNEPAAFYALVADARDKRQTVYQSTLLLQKQIQTYKAEFETFARGFQEKKP